MKTEIQNTLISLGSRMRGSDGTWPYRVISLKTETQNNVISLGAPQCAGAT
jgi:hypothetical protein